MAFWVINKQGMGQKITVEERDELPIDPDILRLLSHSSKDKAN